MGRITCCLAAMLVLLERPLPAHEPSPDQSPQGDSTGMVLPDFGGPKPWSEKPLLNDSDRFHFAIMTDRTGGHRPGVWMKAVHQLNLLRPEFVVSVGDLIEGYSDDRKVVEGEWNEFLGFIKQLDMRFFFVAGNHDVTNPMMHEIWRKHFGAEWYSFDYKGVHFVCLSSEDPQSRIGEKQLSWLRNDLEQHAGARWTMVFLHKPLWVYGEREIAAGNADPTNWKRIERLLAGRPHTVFAGHVHHYVQFDRNGTQYYQLGTTGGGSRLRGKSYGEFDHVVWLTMERTGPRIANLLLDGVLAPDVVTERGIKRFREFLADSSVYVTPILIESGEHLAEGTISIHLNNNFDEDVELQGEIAGLPLRGLMMEEKPLSMRVPAGSSRAINVRFRLNEPLHFARFAQTLLTAKLHTKGTDALAAEIAVPVTIDRRFALPRSQITVDGVLMEWSGEEHSQELLQPLIIGASEQWQGAGDASVRLRLAYDTDHLFLAASVTDDRVIPSDRIYVNLDCRPFGTRVTTPRLGEHAHRITVVPPLDGSSVQAHFQDSSHDARLQVAAEATQKGYDLELAIPINILTEAQSEDWQSLQLTLILNDKDEETDRTCLILWRGTRDVRRQNTNYAHFFRN